MDRKISNAYYLLYFSLCSHLTETVSYLLTSKLVDRQASFLSVGFVAYAVKEHIKPHLPKVFEAIRSALPQANRQVVATKGFVIVAYFK